MIHPGSTHYDTSVAALLRSCVGSPTEEKLQRIWADYHSSPILHLNIHSRAQEAVGLIGVERDDGQSTIIRHIAVASHAQRNGLGREMIEDRVRPEVRGKKVEMRGIF